MRLLEIDAVPNGSTVRLIKELQVIPIDSDLTFHLSIGDIGIVTKREQADDTFKYLIFMKRTRVLIEAYHDDLEIVRCYPKK